MLGTIIGNGVCCFIRNSRVFQWNTGCRNMTGGHEHKKSSSSAGQSQGREHNLPLGSCIENPCWDDLETPGRLLLKHRVDMDEEDGRCLLDVICDPQALNDFLHGPDQIGGDDLLDNTGDAASAFFVGTGLHVQEAPGNHLTTESNPPTSSVDLDFLEDDDILGSPSAGSASLASADQPCDILQQSLQEANITEQTLEAEAELDLGSFQLPTLQPVVQAAPDGTPQIFSGGADLIGLQQPAVLTHQALVQQSVGGDVVNKAISVQPFLQQVGLGNVTIQPISNLPGLPNGSPGGALGIGQIQVVGQQVMAINQPAQQIIAKQVQSTQVANLPVGSYLTGANTEQQQVTLTSSGVSPQNTGLVLQNKIPTVATTLNGNSMFGSVSAAQCTQSLTVTSSLNSPVIIQRTPTPIQPKPAGVLPQKLFQISPKPFTPNNATLTIQGEAALQQPKTQQNLAFMTGKPGPNVLLSSFPQGLPTNMFKQPPSQQHSLGKPMSVHLLNQGSSIVIPAQHAQAMLQGQNQFLLPGQLAGASAVQPLSALQANMGGQILAASHPSGQAHIIASQGPGGQLLNQALPAQILTNQNIASQLNLGQVLASQNAHGTAHIFSGQIQLQAGQVGQPTLFQMPVSLAGSLSTQSQASVATSLNQAGQTVIQGVTLPNQVAMFNPSENLGQAVSIQQTPGGSSQSPGIVQQQSQQVVQGSSILPNADQASILTVQTAQQASHGQPQLQLNVQQQTQPQQTIPVQSQPSPSLATSPDKIILGGTPSGTILSAESMQMFLQQMQQLQQGLMLPSHQPATSTQTSPALGGQYSGQAPSVLTSGQGQSVPTQGPLLGHSPGQVQVGGSSQTAHLSTLLQQQQATVLVNNSGPATVPLDANVYPGTVGKSVSGQSKSIATLPVQTPAKTAVISSVSGLSLGKGSVQIQFVGKGISQIVPTAQTTTQPQFESKFGALKTLPTLQPSKEACFLEHLHKHQGSVLHPDYKSPFHSFEDAFHRLLPYHVYQGLLPTTQDLRKVDDEFEVVSTQLLKRTQAMLNKYRLLLLEESRRVSPSAEMVMIDRMFIQEEKVTLSLDRQLAKERPDEYVSSSSSRSQTFVPTTPSVSSSPCPVSTPETLKPTVVQTSNPIHPTKLVIKHSGGGSPSVTWAKASPSLDTDEDALPSRSRPPIKTYEARSRIGLKLKIKQEAGLSKVIHNTALDPVHQNPPPPLPPPAPPTVPTCTVIKAAVQSSPATITTPTGQMNGTLEHSLPAEKKPLATYCRLPLRKTYRENVDAFVTGKPGGVLSKMDKPAQPPPVMQQVKQEDGSRSVITSHKTQGSSNTEKAKKEESAKLGIYNRVESKLNNSDENPVVLRHDVKDDDQSYYRRIIKTEPPDNETELNWEMQLPSAKRLKTEHFDVDNASFSSDSPQDDTLNEHLQSAIDSILNLQQPQSGAGTNSLLRSSTQTSYHHSSSSSPFSSPVHRTDSYLTPNHNGGLGTRTLNR
ncbi:BRD4-interacting chromatin-remodeling complex-associated protein isoform X5 [Xenopus laevis]|uniref:BRD4-interacting chromatin-remodeling complex-associated protein isoform X5 n=1 Tax=Xenopus laevis TaxID=8355 RepID=A0A8J0TJE7_XENLA|nr:BRD4-interacting chromatin-remodeling complex-associated protein isoform X5 [Xenopus laevis]